MPRFGGLQLRDVAERLCDNVIQIPTTDPVHHITDSIQFFILKLNKQLEMALKQDNLTSVSLTQNGECYMTLNLAGTEKNIHLK